MDTGSGELLEGVTPISRSDSLGKLTLHAEVEAGLDVAPHTAEIQSELEAEAPQSIEEAAAAIAQVAVELDEESGPILI